jgi:tetratricopeptide (TPR) repeat protein
MSPASCRDAAILVALTFAVFAPTLSAEFVYDARLQILTDPFLHDPRNWFDVLSFRVLARDVLDFNRPVQLASLMLDAAIWGREPFGYHLTSILLHCGNVVLLWLVIRDVFRRGPGGPANDPDCGRWPALLGAALFAVHPLVTEAVCEPTFREDLLVATFSLGAIVQAARMGGAGDLLPAAGSAVCCLLAVASKESGIAAPVILAAYWWLFRRDESRRAWLTAIGGGAALVAVFVAARFLLEPSPAAIFESKPVYPGGSFAKAMEIEPRILALYAQLIVLPMNLCADYGMPNVAHLPLSLALVILAAVATLLVIGGRADRRIAFGAALLVLPLVPVANLVPIYRAAADRYLYLPLAGVAVIVAALLDSRWLQGSPAPDSGSSLKRKQVALVGTLTALVALGLACMERQRIWATQLALWQDTAARNPGSYTAAQGLAGALREADRLAEAEAAARGALQLSSGQRGEAWASLALVLDAQGRTTEADEAVAKAVEVDPRLEDPEARVRILAMEAAEARELRRLLDRRSRR